MCWPPSQVSRRPRPRVCPQQGERSTRNRICEKDAQCPAVPVPRPGQPVPATCVEGPRARAATTRGLACPFRLVPDVPPTHRVHYKRPPGAPFHHLLGLVQGHSNCLSVPATRNVKIILILKYNTQKRVHIIREQISTYPPAKSRHRPWPARQLPLPASRAPSPVPDAAAALMSVIIASFPFQF